MRKLAIALLLSACGEVTPVDGTGSIGGNTRGDGATGGETEAGGDGGSSGSVVVVDGGADLTDDAVGGDTGGTSSRSLAVGEWRTSILCGEGFTFMLLLNATQGAGAWVLNGTYEARGTDLVTGGNCSGNELGSTVSLSCAGPNDPAFQVTGEIGQNSTGEQIMEATIHSGRYACTELTFRR